MYLADVFKDVAICNKNLVIMILIVTCNKENSVFFFNRAGNVWAWQCREGPGRAGQGRAGQGTVGQCRSGQGTVFPCRYEGSDILLKLAESEEKICSLVNENYNLFLFYQDQQRQNIYIYIYDIP